MNRSCVPLSLVAVLIFVALTEGAERGEQGGLSLTIVTSKDGSGSSVIDYNSKFQVLFTNHSKEPIRLWSERCELGHATLSFRVQGGGGPAAIMCKRVPSPSAWKNNPPKTITVPPGGTSRWEVSPRAFFWGVREWIALPEPNTGTPFTLTAVFEIKRTELAKQQGVWTGRITSEPLRALVVDPTLRTPHEYLEAGFPKVAIKLMDADRHWIPEEDKMQQTPLHVAAHEGLVDAVRWLLAHGADVNARCYNQFTPLHLAKDPGVVELLLEHKADPDARDAFGRTALQGAAQRYAHLSKFRQYRADRDCARAIAKILIGAGAEYDLVSACCLGDLERVRQIDKRLAGNPEALRLAATYGQTEIVKLLLERGADPDDGGYGGLTISYYAIEHPDVLKLLFDAGADPKVRVEYRGMGHGPHGSTLLHEAAGKGIIESAKLLLARGAKLDVQDSRGATPLDAACHGGHVAMVDWLLRNKANINAHGDWGRTPMFLAMDQAQPDHDEDNARYQAVIRSLERAGVKLDVFAAIVCNDVKQVAAILQADPKAAEREPPRGLPALHRAVNFDRREIVKLLLDKGCDPNIRSQAAGVGYKGETALLQAAFWGRLEIAEMLIKHGADVNAKAERGIVPLHEAARLGNVEVARLLLEHGADVDVRDDKGHTPLDGAREPEMIELLRKYGAK